MEETTAPGPLGVARTHEAIDPGLCGRAVEVAPGRAVVRLATTEVMAADRHGLVHGGFLFSAADHAAMLAVNEPTVVLTGAEIRFRAPVRVGEVVDLVATVEPGSSERRPVVRCIGRRGGTEFFRGTFRCVILDDHVLVV